MWARGVWGGAEVRNDGVSNGWKFLKWVLKIGTEKMGGY